MDLINQAVKELNRATFTYRLSTEEILERKREVERRIKRYNTISKRPLSITLVYKARV